MTENIPEARFIPMTSLAKAVGPLDGRGNLPLYQELQRALRKAIDSRLLAPDDALPSERDLAADFAVSRITVRKALDGLVADGLLVRRQGAGFVRIIHTSRMPERYYSTGRIRFAPLPRAVADAARGMTRLSDARAVVAEAVQHGRCSLEALIRELNEGPMAGSRFYRIALGEIGDGIRSAAEADLRELIHRSDLETPLYNPELYAADGSFLGIPDAWWQRAGVAAEVDSRQFHLSPDDYERTTMRHNRMEASGISMLHFLPSTLRSKSPTVLRDLRGAIKAGNSKPPLPIVAIPARA